MMLLKLAFRNLSRNSLRTGALALLVGGSVALMTLGTALLDGTEAGLRRSYVESFAGDVAVRADSGEAFSLFGSPTPIVGDFKEMPTIAPYAEASRVLSEDPRVEAVVPVVCGNASLSLGGYKEPVSVFGLRADEYLAAFPAARVAAGAAFGPGERGIMLTRARADKIAASIGRPLAPGDSLTLGSYSPMGFRLREARLSGILEYPVRNEALDSIVLADDRTMRELGALELDAGGGPSSEASAAASGSMDSLFAGASDTVAEGGGGISLAEVESLVARPVGADEAGGGGAGSWHFLVARLKPGARAGAVIGSLNARFRKEGWALTAGDWRSAAGASAIYAYWLRVLLDAGFLVVVAAGCLVVVNAMMLSVFERAGEIGTMRALGASRGFVRGLFVAESLELSLASAAAGAAAGAALAAALNARGIAVSNELLATLFGSSRLELAVTARSILCDFAAAAALGLVAGAYPARAALRIQPARAAAME